MLAATAVADTSNIKASNNQVDFQFISTDVDYTETGYGIFGTPTGKLDTESGYVPGYGLSISAMKDLWFGNDYFEVEYNHSNGNTNYMGSSIFGGPFGSVVSTSSAVLENYSARYGKGFIVGDDLMLTPFVEVGHHRWDRGVNAGEIYTNDYYGIGALGQFSTVNKMVFTVNALLGGTFKSNITVNSLGGGLGGFSGALGNSTLYRAGVSVDYAFTKSIHGNAGVDFTSFKYGISAVYPIGGGFVAWEPDSLTNYTTFKLGLGFAF